MRVGRPGFFLLIGRESRGFLRGSVVLKLPNSPEI